MGIVFFCQSCGARFEVDPRMAGKRGHCKQCGQRMMIPRAEEIASMSGMPALAVAGVGAGGVAAPAVGSSIASWIKAGLSNAALAPISVDRLKPARAYLPSALDDAEDSRPYVLAQPERQSRGRATAQANAALNLWRRQLGGIQKVFRKISQAAYLVSVPFLLILLLGVALKSRPTALLGATAVVLLNIGRLVAGAANLAVVPLRDGINPGKLRKPAWRVAEPALTIGLVVLAFTFIPWLSRGQAGGGSIAERIRSEVQDLKTEIKGEVKRVADVDQLGARAQQKLRELGTSTSDGPTVASPPGEGRP
jgi:DNA-directed RNA polymerase subunit RPC12/RpoP